MSRRMGVPWERSTPLGPALVTPDELGVTGSTSVAVEADRPLVATMAQGNLTQSVPKSEDGSLMQGMQHLQVRLREIINQVSQACGTFKTASSELVNVASGLSGSAEKQADSSNATAVSVEQMSASAKSISNYAHKTEVQAKLSASPRRKSSPFINRPASM